MPAITWTEFANRFRREYISELTPASQVNLRTTLNLVDKILQPKKPADVANSRALAMFVSHLRDERGCSPESVDQHLARLMRVLSWGCNAGLCKLPSPPARPGKRKTYQIPGRALTQLEYMRMLAAAPKVTHRASRFVFALMGLWTSGLRITELLSLTWGPSDFYVDRDGEEWLLRISAKLNKNTFDEVIPVPPDFRELLESVPVKERTGYVFKLTRYKSDLSRLIANCAREADVVVRQGGKQKYASAHDFRRSFATRWAKVVLPPTLQKMMRHGSLKTTMRHYVTLDAMSIAKQLREAKL